jgi:8-oxo-dGTP pyrophosphatase MutT (NUDIX family)
MLNFSFLISDRALLIESLNVYDSPFANEKPFVAQFLHLLQHPAAFQRHHLPGHITGSSWIMDASRQFVLLVHHGTLNKWLQPGGHADGEENVLNVALREAREETGVLNLKVLKDDFFDLDIHPIPARSGFPNHLHYDVRFLFEAAREEKLVVSEESHDVAWVNINALHKLTDGNPSILRMVEKMESFKR